MFLDLETIVAASFNLSNFSTVVASFNLSNYSNSINQPLELQ